jgi:GDP-4-dehydro-6-deoxy-D-mannose reductase
VAGPSLVTGATGFAGSHLADQLIADGRPTVGWANPWGRNPSIASPLLGWQQVDLLDRDSVARAVADARPAAIYHCAGIAHVGATWSDPARALQVNVLGTHNLLEAVREAKLECPVLVTGSALVYRPATEPLTELHPIGPDSPYGVSKLAQEMTAQRAAGVRTILVRPFNHAGPRQDDAYVTSSFARQIAEIEAGLREPVLHVGNLEARRDITDVRDTVRAYRMLVDRGGPGPYNVCRGEAYRVADLLDILVSLAKTTFRIQPDPARMRPSDNPLVLGSAARLAADTGWAPVIPIERTLRDLLDSWRGRVVSAS